MSNRKLSVALAGIGGYGHTYLSSLLDDAGHRAQLVAAADPNPSSCVLLPELQRMGIPIYPSTTEMQQRHSPELVVISTPLQLHSDHVVAALEGASHVLCEKPLCSTPQQAAKMIAARQKAARQVSIGYQWSFNPCIQALKEDITSGIFGRPKRLRTLVLWPRPEAYYQRNQWAGRRYTKSGLPIFDSPLNNACAHHMHNMLYLLGDAPGHSASAANVTAELYRANAIETFDTAAVRIWTTHGVEASIVVSHAALPQVQITAAAHQSVPEAIDFPAKLVHFNPDGTSVRRWVEGLDDILIKSYTTGKLPSELGATWGVPGQTIHLAERTIHAIDPKFKINARVQIMPQLRPKLDSLPETV
jgi:predicted dehydrogenase